MPTITIMLEARIELAQHADRVGLGADPRVIPLGCFLTDEGFGHAVRLRAFDPRRAWHQADVARQRASHRRCRASRCPTATRSLGQLLTRLKRRSRLSTIRLRMSELLMPPVVARDRLAVAAVEREGDPYLLAVPVPHAVLVRQRH